MKMLKLQYLPSRANIGSVPQNNEVEYQSTSSTDTKVPKRNNLESSDYLELSSLKKRDQFVSAIEDFIGNAVTLRPEISIGAFSHTSRKIVVESNGLKYVVKKKPDYCRDSERLSFFTSAQNIFARYLSFVHPIKSNKNQFYILFDRSYSRINLFWKALRNRVNWNGPRGIRELFRKVY